MPLPWKKSKSKSKSGRISRFVSDLQQSPKHGGSLVVETGFPTSLIDLFVKNCDRLKKSSSKRKNKAQNLTALNPRQRCLSSLSSPSLQPPSPPLQRVMSVPQMFDSSSVSEDPSASKIEEISVSGGGLTAENWHNGDDSDNRGEYVLMMVMFKVLMVAVLALSTKKLTMGITLSTFALIFLELVMARGFTLLNISPDVKIRLNSLIGKLIGKRQLEKPEESSSTHEIIEESRDCREQIQVAKSNLEDSSTLENSKPVAEEIEMNTMRDMVLKKQKSKRSKLKSKIVKKWRSLKKDKKLKNKEEEEEEPVTEVSSMFSEEIIESEISEKDYIVSNPPLLESFEEIEEKESGSKGDLTKLIVLIVIILTGLLSGKVLAIFLTLSWCLILRFVCNKSQTSL